MTAQHKIWCDKDGHQFYEHYADFNDWLDGEEGLAVLEEYGINSLAQPSKAFYAGDKAAYDQAFEQYRLDRLHEALNQTYLVEQFGDNHWFERNLDRFEQLIRCIAEGGVVPFIGAGISVAGKFPTWKDHLRQQGKTANIDAARIEQWLAEGQYETIIEAIENRRGRQVFIQEIRDVFSRTGTIPETIWCITELFTDTVITTNYDRLIEQAYDTGDKNAFQIINDMKALEPPAADRVTIIKLHGDIQNPAKCILSKNQYDQAYGLDTLDMELPIPKLLAYYFKNSSLLFLGCSLNNDRTVQVFQAIKAQSDEDLPQHFSIEQAPEDKDELAERNAFLLRLGITAIWFKKEAFESIESLLSLAKYELGYLRNITLQPTPVPQATDASAVLPKLELSEFLSDFVDLMPLLYWLHRRIPKCETRKYLLAMQRVFHAKSLFTETTNELLLGCLDNILRVLSSSPRFDGYAHEKLSSVFGLSQRYLQSIAEQNYLHETFEWSIREMMSIPLRQFENLIAVSPPDTKLDFHAIRLIIALLKHGLKQEHSPKQFCELPDAVNLELGDYLALSLESNLGVLTPDRLDDMVANDINRLCQNAWDEFDRQPELGFLDGVRIMLADLFVKK